MHGEVWYSLVETCDGLLGRWDGLVGRCGGLVGRWGGLVGKCGGLVGRSSGDWRGVLLTGGVLNSRNQ